MNDRSSCAAGVISATTESIVSQLEPLALDATRAAALACAQWVGRGDAQAADGAATEAMRSVLADAAELAGNGLFAGCGVTGGPLLAGPDPAGSLMRTESIVVAAGETRRVRLEGRG
jgi:fructose-1,6-bisphosphatase II